MKIAVTSNGTGLDDQVEARFGRCPYFLIIDSDTMAVYALPNPNISLGGGAGPQSAQLMAEQGVLAVLTGNCGPNAFQAFGAAGIKVITGVTGQVRNAVMQFKAGGFVQSSASNVQSHFGMGGGGKMGRGCGGGGGGRGMGGGIRRLQNTGEEMTRSTVIQTVTPNNASLASENEITQLKATAENLRSQLQAIENQIKTIAKQNDGTEK
ncbi:MAG: NifB/NifX family molybdenum-iron cluster-binding protein [Desulfobacteraceae bacterium]|jgi:predicted Fe-Mo cluster-binding NifX family protein